MPKGIIAAMLVRLSWGLIALQLLFGIAVALYPRLYPPAPSGPTGAAATAARVPPDQAFYGFAALVILNALVQAADKATSLSRNRGKLSGQKFLEQYTNALTESIRTLQLLPLRAEQVESAQKQLLRFVAEVVALYYEDRTGLSISASLMIPAPTAEFCKPEGRFQEAVHFADPLRNHDTYSCVLRLTVASDPLPNVPAEFVLPVDTDGDRLLFGSPRAFATGAESVVANTGDIGHIKKLLTGQPESVVSQVVEFLDKQNYKSLASLPLRLSERRVGVITIQSNQTDIFGKNERNAAEIKRYIGPLMDILAILSLPQATKPEAPRT